MRSTLTALALAASLAAPPALAVQPGPAPVFAIGAWSGLRHTSAAGELVYCTAVTSIGTRDGLSIRLEPDGGVGIAVTRRDWNFSRKTTEADFVIDGVTIATQARVGDADLLYVEFDAPDNQAVYNRLGAGKVLTVQTRKGNQTFDLGTLDEVMPKLYDCAMEPPPSRGKAAPAPAAAPPATPFDVPGATRVDKSQVMAVLANSMADHDEPRHKFLLAGEMAEALPGYDVGWRTETGMLVGTAVRGRIGKPETDAIIGNLLALDAGRCAGKMRIEIDPPRSAAHTSTDIHAYCDGGGNGKETHYLIWTFDNGGVMVTRFEPVTMQDPRTLLDEIYKD